MGALHDGEVRAVQARTQSIALTCHRGEIGALDNACPHQGGPLGEGSIECNEGDDDCWLRCPWHGWDFHPLTGRSPGECRVVGDKAASACFACHQPQNEQDYTFSRLRD